MSKTNFIIRINYFHKVYVEPRYLVHQIVWLECMIVSLPGSVFNHYLVHELYIHVVSRNITFKWDCICWSCVNMLSPSFLSFLLTDTWASCTWEKPWWCWTASQTPYSTSTQTLSPISARHCPTTSKRQVHVDRLATWGFPEFSFPCFLEVYDMQKKL